MYDAHKEIKIAQTDYNNTVDERIDYMQNILKRRRYVPLESLPALDFNTELGTINEGESKCLSVPIYVGSENTPNFDCTVLCDNPAAAYFFVGEYDRFVVNGQLLTRGGYCTTNSIPRNCNRETSVVLHSLNQWSCIAEDPRYFAGPENMVQIAGRQHANRIAPGQINRNILFDRLLGMEVDVSRNTFRQSWDETLPNSNERRFVVQCNALDDHNNRMFLNPLNPLECLPNICTNVSNVHPDVKPDFEKNICDCGDFNVTRVRNIDPGDPTSICASVINTFNRDLMSHQVRVECSNMDLLISKYNRNNLLCPPTIFNQNTDNAFVFTLPGSFPISINGRFEPTYRFYMDTRDRVNYRILRNIPSS
ncbi:PIF-2 [Rachiplusia nu nucleopolyhedrovirus]|uniref:PIF-2 n=1 Tax=Rachiplusia nu nucleopolyhedrovirus TaxID=2605775 RepID=A0AAE6M6I6_9ABAC|nr:PIF-2 [Rachiplusia nu nucleopolyhedrovirus]QEI03637.1 PIF-2 [Rachiplusia nu nucleopolyhedrovirus]